MLQEGKKYHFRKQGEEISFSDQNIDPWVCINWLFPCVGLVVSDSEFAGPLSDTEQGSGEGTAFPYPGDGHKTTGSTTALSEPSAEPHTPQVRFKSEQI